VHCRRSANPRSVDTREGFTYIGGCNTVTVGRKCLFSFLEIDITRRDYGRVD
jgi:hypothetical protein